MAHFAQIINGNRVGQVIVAEQDFIDTLNGEWVQTSYNTREGEHILGGKPFRGNYASPGMIWDADKDAFYDAPPYDNWKLNETKWVYEPPIEMPTSIPKGFWEWKQEENKWVDSPITQPNK